MNSSSPSPAPSPRVLAWRTRYYAFRAACRLLARSDTAGALAIATGPQSAYVVDRLKERADFDGRAAAFLQMLAGRLRETSSAQDQGEISTNCHPEERTRENRGILSPSIAARQTAEQLEDRLRFASLEGYIPTPHVIAARMVHLADIIAGERVLQACAGSGRVVEAILTAEPFANVDACELAIAAREVLVVKQQYRSFALVGSDLLRLAAPPTYDVVVMHPPLSAGVDVAFVLHSWRTQLTAGGRLVAIVAEASLFRGDRDSQRLAELVTTCGHVADGELIAGGIGDPPATPARIIVLRKPE